MTEYSYKSPEAAPDNKAAQSPELESKEHEKLSEIANSLETDSKSDYVQALKNLIKSVVAKF